MEFQVGETHSGYEFLEVLQRSKNGVEFRVKNTLVGRIETLRTIPEGSQHDPEQSERFLRQMRVHAGLIHPNIVTLFSAVELGNQLAITTELVDGLTVAGKLSSGPLQWVEAVGIARQILAAVAYAHQQGIVHRNISPENIIISAGGVVKLANFALAKGAASPRLTQVGVAIGNLKYTSPEQIKGIGEVDGRSDLYSLGMVLYEMLCGRPAFVMESEFELMAAQVASPPASPDEVNPQVPRALGPVLLKALAKNPAGRFQTAAEFDDALAGAGELPKIAPVETKTVAPPAAAAPLAARPAPPPVAAIAREDPPRAPDPPQKPEDLLPPPVLPTAPEEPVPQFLAAPPTQVLSRQQIVIASAAGACTGVLLAVVWLFVK
jgi:eukaryotic-like serine/threonine-protein kinase